MKIEMNTIRLNVRSLGVVGERKGKGGSGGGGGGSDTPAGYDLFEAADGDFLAADGEFYVIS